MTHKNALNSLRRLLPFFALLLAVSTAGCYKSVPIEGAPTLGREVVLDITEQGALELAPQLGAQLKTVSGRIGDLSTSEFRVSVTQTTNRGGVETLWRGEDARIPRMYVSNVYERRVDKKRSWIVVGVTVVGVVLAGEAFGINTGLDGLIGGGGRGSKQ